MSTDTGIKERRQAHACLPLLHLAGTVSLGLCSAAAHAQVVDIPPTAAERIERRETPEGIRAGGLVLLPRIEAEIELDDNVFAESTNTNFDIIANLAANGRAQSDWGRHAIYVEGFLRHRQFVDLSDESTTEFGAFTGGRVDIANRMSIAGNARFAQLYERRGDLDAQQGADSPAGYTNLEGDIAFTHTINRFRYSLAAGYRRLSYQDITVGGVERSQEFRDQEIGRLTGTLQYELSPKTSLLMRAELQQRRYDQRLGDPGFDPTDFDLSADGFRLEAGFARQLGSLISGSLRVGYLEYDYPDSRIAPISGLSYAADLRWDVTPLTSIRLVADRRLDEQISPLSTGSLRDSVLVGVQHELLRTIILDGAVSYVNNNASGVQPDSDEFSANFLVSYYFTDEIVFNAGLYHRRRNSDAPNQGFTTNRFLIGITYRR